MREKLLSHLYSALDKSPKLVICLRVHHPDGFAWSVEDGILQASTEAGSQIGTFNLEDYTVAELGAVLSDLGCSLIYKNDDVLHRTAAALMSGSGKQSQSNGDALEVIDSVLWSVVDAYASEIKTAGVNLDEALKQLYLETADGEWLDLWGQFFGIQRGSMSDAVYRQYLIDETLRPRSNSVSVEKAVKELTGKKIGLYEPWKDLFVVGVSALGGDHHMQDGNFYTYNVFQPRSVEPLQWGNVDPVIKRNKPAGVIQLPHGTIFPTRKIAYSIGDFDIASIGNVLRVARAIMAGDEALDVGMVLSAGEIVRNAMASIFQIRGLTNEGLPTVYQVLEPFRSISKATVCLSDGVRLGELNARFGHGITGHVDGPEFLSGTATEDGYKLSDVINEDVYDRVPEIVEFEHKASLPFVDVVAPARAESRTFLRYARPTKNVLNDARLSDYVDDREMVGSRINGKASFANLRVNSLMIKEVWEAQRGTQIIASGDGEVLDSAVSLTTVRWASRLTDLGYWRGPYVTGRRWHWDGEFDGATPLQLQSSFDFVPQNQTTTAMAEALKQAIAAMG